MPTCPSGKGDGLENRLSEMACGFKSYRWRLESLFYWGNNMDINREYNNIESSFAMEDLIFDEECAKRVKSVLSGELSVQDAIAELNEKYKKNCKSV